MRWDYKGENEIRIKKFHKNFILGYCWQFFQYVDNLQRIMIALLIQKVFSLSAVAVWPTPPWTFLVQSSCFAFPVWVETIIERLCLEQNFFNLFKSSTSSWYLPKVVIPLSLLLIYAQVSMIISFVYGKSFM